MGRRALVRAMLASAAHDRPLRLSGFPAEAEVRSTVESGLGPLLAYLLGDAVLAWPPALQALVRGSELAGRVTAAERGDAMAAILDAWPPGLDPPVLLKGISLAEAVYPQPHLRDMCDIDFLVGGPDIPQVEGVLESLGYRRESGFAASSYASHHHTMPFRHPRSDVWVEVHRGLFPTHQPFGADLLFTPPTLGREQHPSSFGGRKVTRLNPELQLFHTAAHWTFGFRVTGGAVALFDVIYLLKRTESLAWTKMGDWLRVSAAAHSVSLLLGYLGRHGLVSLPPELRSQLAPRTALEKVEVRLVHSLVDRYLVGGHPVGRFMTRRTLTILWRNLTRAQPERSRLLMSAWNLLPSRVTGRENWV